MFRRVVQFDGERLERLAGVKLGLSELMTLADMASIYSERFREPLPNFMLAYCSDPNERVARRAFVEAVWETWRDCRRKRPRRPRDERRRSYRRGLFLNATHKHCINLLLELFEAVGEKPPSVVTLRHDLATIQTGRERRH
jgi:hypothetical protein